MILPRSRLLVWVAVIVLPFSLLGAVEPAASGLSLVILGGLAALTFVDALKARASLIGISVEVPVVARMSKERESRLELRIRNASQRAKTVRLGLALPREIHSPQEEALVALPAGSEWSRFDWPCLPLKRGNYRLGSVHLETASPLGFWAARSALPVIGEIRVYPNLLKERRNLAALFLHRGAFGLHAQRQVGKGREFEKLREYVPGDGYDEVHWKATAKRGHPITKVFQIERTQEIYVIIDASRLSARSIEGQVSRVEPAERGIYSASPQKAPTRPAGDNSVEISTLKRNKFRAPLLPHSTLDPRPSTPVLERFITAALVLGLAAEQQGDLFGLLTFTNKVETFVRAKNGKAHYSACRDALYTLQPQVVTPDFDELCAFIRLRLRRRALLVVLTSLDDPVLAESFVRNLELIRRHHLVLVNMIQPPGISPIFTNPNIATLDELFQHLGGHLLWHNLRELESVLKKRGVRFSLVQDERLSVELVSQYLNVKRRQAL